MLYYDLGLGPMHLNISYECKTWQNKQKMTTVQLQATSVS